MNEGKNLKIAENKNKEEIRAHESVYHLVVGASAPIHPEKSVYQRREKRLKLKFDVCSGT